MHVEIGYRKICHLVNCIQLVTMRLSSNLRTGLVSYRVSGELTSKIQSLGLFIYIYLFT